MLWGGGQGCNAKYVAYLHGATNSHTHVKCMQKNKMHAQTHGNG